jgi:hypothetical protein
MLMLFGCDLGVIAIIGIIMLIAPAPSSAGT